MTRFLNWWMSCPCDFKYAAAGIISPYLIMALAIWLCR